MYRIKIDRSLCIGCLTCVTACVVTSEKESGDAKNRVTIDRNSKPAPIFCRHCDLPECVYTCMTGAMEKNSETGYVEYDEEACASCGMCVMSCPYGVLKFDSVKRTEILKCNMCVHRNEDGTANPMCVEKCPTHAITIEEV